MGLIVILTAATALATLGFILSHPKIEEDWRDQAEGLRQRREYDEAPHASYEDDRAAGHAYDRLNL
jgi:hypothetical protein